MHTIERTLLVAVIVIAGFFRLYHLPTSQPEVIQIAFAGILTVVGLYFLARILYNRQIASIAGFLLATSYWHTLMSRSGLSEVLAPMFLVWALFFFFQALQNGHWFPFALSGLCWGLGFYGVNTFLAMPLVLVLTLIAYWQALHKDFNHQTYLHARHRLAVGLEILIAVAFLVSLPAIWSFANSQNGLFTNFGHLSLSKIVSGITQFVSGADDPRYSAPGSPLLFWLISALFAVGLIREFIKLFRHKKTHGHLATAHVMGISWFLIAVIMAAWSVAGPNGRSLTLAAPIAYLFAAQALWWIFEILESWYHARDVHELKISNPYHHRMIVKESSIMSAASIVVLLLAVGFAEFYSYFYQFLNK